LDLRQKLSIAQATSEGGKHHRFGQAHFLGSHIKRQTNEALSVGDLLESMTPMEDHTLIHSRRLIAVVNAKNG
jgi:hypothetical protein